MKTWKKMLLYLIGLFRGLTDSIKNTRKKWKLVTPILMTVVMLLGMLSMPTSFVVAGTVKAAEKTLSETVCYGMSASTSFSNDAVSSYAGISSVTYTVSFDGNGARSGSMESVTGVSGEYTLPENNWPINGFYPDMNMYFAGWLVDGTIKAPGEKINVTGDITVKAIWEKENYGLTIGGIDVTYQNTSAVTGTGISGTVSYDPVTQILTLNNATIHSAYMGGTITSAIYTGYYHDGKLTIHLEGNNTVYGDPYGEAATSSHRYAISCEDISFTGDGNLNVTASDAEGGSFYYAIHSDGNITIDEDCTIVAISKFGRALSSYNGNLVANNSSVLASTSAEGAPLVAYDELGMNNSKYIKIQPAYNITVSFDANGGSGTMADESVVCSKEYTLPANGFTAPAGKQFKAWSVDGTEKAVGDKIAVVANTIVTAVWEDIPVGHTCTIEPVAKVWPTCEDGGKEAYYKCEGCGKFFEDANGAVEITDITTWGNLTKLGHTEGEQWKSDKDNHWKECTCGNKTNTAAHKDENTDGKCDACGYDVGVTTTNPDTYNITVSFGANGGSGTMADESVVCSKEYTLPANGFTAPAGKQFKAWSVDGTEKAVGDKIAVVANTIVTAVWEDIPAGHTCTIELVAKVWPTCEDGGKEAYYKCEGCGKFFEDVNAAVEITDITTWGNLTKLGHTEGEQWKSDKDNHWKECTCGNKTNTAAHKDENTDGKCDTCGYDVGTTATNPDTYNITVSFDANGGSGTMADESVVCSKEYTLPANGFTAPAGKQFKAWSVDGTEKAVGDKIAVVANTIVTAVWEDIPVGHTCTIEPVAKVWPTCEEGGKEAYYKCEGCGKFFEDANGAVEITDITTWGNLTKLGHTEGEQWKSDKDKISDSVKAPQTVDNSRMRFWGVMLFVSVFGVVATGVTGRKKFLVKNS